MLTEFGGIAFSRQDGDLGVFTRGVARSFEQQYGALLCSVNSLGLLAGFCYTQFADTYQEANGLLYGNRTPKFPLDQIARATKGCSPAEDVEEAGSNPHPSLTEEVAYPMPSVSDDEPH